jgi:integrase
MAIHKLTALHIKQASRKARHNDGGGLYLDVAAGGTKIWLFRWSVLGAQRYLSLGSLADGVTVEQARDEAARLRKLIRDGGDPRAQRAQAVQAPAETQRHLTFAQLAAEWAEAHLTTTFRNQKDRNRWQSDLDRYASALLKLPVAAITTEHVLQAIKPIWQTKTTTAKKLRQSLEQVLDYAGAAKYRQGENPARWRGHLSALLPSAAKLIRDKAAPRKMLPFADVPALLAELRQRDDVAAFALRFLILTAVRPGDIIGGGEQQVPLAWSHITGDVWTIPVTKTQKNFTVPLNAEALEILAVMRARCESQQVFPGLSHRAMLRLCKSLRPVDVHGFRSSFSTWGSEPAQLRAFPRVVTEAALGHATENEVAGKYNRTQYLEARRPLMDAWGAFCASPAPAGLVVSLGRAA